jgi:glycosyltransferase involved in cell wall biosynthesis
MPNVVLEAMQAGKAVVATRIPGMNELVVDGETGLLVEAKKPFGLARAMRELLVDPVRRDAMGAAGKKRVAEYFSVERMVDSYASLYDELLG